MTNSNIGNKGNEFSNDNSLRQEFIVAELSEPPLWWSWRRPSDFEHERGTTDLGVDNSLPGKLHSCGVVSW